MNTIDIICFILGILLMFIAPPTIIGFLMVEFYDNLDKEDNND